MTGPIITPEGSLCSGTVWQKVILTTTHCLAENPEEIRFRGMNMRVVKIIRQGENAMVKVDADLGPSARFGKRPKVGAVTWIVGNPMGLEQAFRQGRIVQYNEGAIVVECMCYHGDSGAGVFDDSGRLVGIFYGAYQDRDLIGGINFAMPYFYPLNFTPAQYAEAHK